ncbi:uncharacterized protein MAM_08132 [Metarhizium album ARSEF 1941]|uniref:Uncharacterized protein n=1 Tax=Metarhizium album (strain ARSEF 1941) TaxID=1081103 RepID=A0A0B2WJB3_METAS|nr:uncharacterized protein MAM_08132 [Metarhizium album ARSEF 1941]KHN94003.1 hypothetical protein MAM_08132 [Metarhizium album ARSEF 1941]
MVDAVGLLWPSDAAGRATSRSDAPSWLEICTGTSAQSLQSNWPWFFLHLVLYIGQLVGFVLIVLHETLPRGGLLRGLGVLAAMGCISSCFGFSIAMPVVSLGLLHHRRPLTLPRARPKQEHKFVLNLVFWLTGITHVGAFLVAFIATVLSEPPSPLHVMNSLLGVPDCSQLPCAEEAQRQARLRQINEMTGTSSGFFLAMGLFCQALEATRKHMSRKLLARMFLVSLVLGPAAGGADALLLQSSLIGHGDGSENQKRTKSE